MNVVDDKANDYLQFASSFIKHQLDSNPSRNAHIQHHISRVYLIAFLKYNLTMILDIKLHRKCKRQLSWEKKLIKNWNIVIAVWKHGNQVNVNKSSLFLRFYSKLASSVYPIIKITIEFVHSFKLKKNLRMKNIKKQLMRDGFKPGVVLIIIWNTHVCNDWLKNCCRNRSSKNVWKKSKGIIHFWYITRKNCRNVKWNLSTFRFKTIFKTTAWSKIPYSMRLL